ncbi:MAG TPA: branched-chain amino acid ABC transporter permease, partial [Thermodesulfobacteriota bacterium]|nr:branched-chain amino acid ABC transporter permease [Thermodesulfobacteriota bacterium]
MSFAVFHRHRLLFFIGGAFLLLFLPVILDRNWLSLVNEMLIMALAGCSLNLMLGYTGMVSFGPAGLYAAGAYTTAILLTRYGAPFPVAVLCAPVVAAAAGAVVGWFCVRRSAVYFALLTLAFSQIIWTIIFEWYDFTGGDNGIVSIPIPEFFFTVSHTYYFSLAIVGACLILLWRIVHSPFGKTLQAIRENAGRAEFIAVHVKRYQLAAFILSSAFLGVAGALFCVFSGSVFPDYAHWAKSTDMLVICLLGGFYNFAGPAVGSVVYILLSKMIAKQTMFWMFFLGVIIVFLVLFMRNGIMGFV